MEIYYINRKTGKKEKEVVAGEKLIRWGYDTKIGSSLTRYILKRKIFTYLYGKIQDLSFSRKKIENFARDLSIDLSEAEREAIAQYENFNDFFARKLKSQARPISSEKAHFISPADGRLLAYDNINIEKIIQVKGMDYSLGELLGDYQLAKNYQGGVCIVIRLCPADYHRFHFPDGGIPMAYKRIDGHYYSVNPIALKKIPKLYCENKREITLFQSDNFGQIAYVDVGATCVGTIVQTYKPGERVQKGQEKGYFKFGGSTVIVFIEKGKIQVDSDLLQNTQKGLETKVNMGERIGVVEKG